MKKLLFLPLLFLFNICEAVPPEWNPLVDYGFEGGQDHVRASSGTFHTIISTNITANNITVDTITFTGNGVVFTGEHDQLTSTGTKTHDYLENELSALPTTYLKLDTSNDPLTGDLTITKTSPALNLIDDVTSSTATIKKVDTNGELSIKNTAALGANSIALEFTGVAESNLASPEPLDTPLSFTNGFTMETLLKVDNTDAVTYIIDAIDSRVLNDRINLFQNTTGDGIWTYRLYNQVTQRSVTSNGAPSGDWEHILCTYETNGKMTMYINGVAQTDTETLAFGTIDVTISMRIGAYTIGLPPGLEFIGDMEFFRFYDYGMNQTSATWQYNSGNYRNWRDLDNHLVGAWEFEEGSGSEVLDYSINKNTMTIEGAGITHITGISGTDLAMPGEDALTTVLTHTDAVSEDSAGVTELTSFGGSKWGGGILDFKTLKVQASGATKMVMDDSGNFGMHVTTPASTLHVAGNVTGSTFIAEDASGISGYEQTGTMGWEVNNDGDVNITNKLTVTDTSTHSKGINASTGVFTSDVDIAGTLTTTGAGGIINTYGILTSSIAIVNTQSVIKSSVSYGIQITTNVEVLGILNADGVYGNIGLNTDIIVVSTAVLVTDGTITAGTVSSTTATDQDYLVVNESGEFKIDFYFYPTDGIPAKLDFIGRYQGNPAHDVWLLMWNYNTKAWVRVTAEDTDFPHSATEDYALEFSLDTTTTGFLLDGQCIARLDHDSSAVGSHNMYIDYIGIVPETLAMPMAGTDYQITGLSPGQSSNMDVGTSSVTISIPGIYLFIGNISFSGKGNSLIQGRIYVNGVSNGVSFKRKLGEGGDVGSAGGNNILSFNKGDVVTFYFTSDTSDAFISIDVMNVSLYKLN